MAKTQESYAVDLDNDPSLYAEDAATPKKVGGVYVRFHLEPKLDLLASWGGIVNESDGSERKVVGAGRPIYKDVEYIEITIPGDRNNIPDRPVTDLDRRKFAEQYKAWKAGDEEQLVGTPLAKWPGITRSQVEELRYFHVRTVEQLADVSDSNAQSMGPILKLRQRARDFLEASKGTAPLEAVRAQLQAKESENDALKKQLDQVQERLSQLEKDNAKSKK
jgi:hypothetical protein